MEGLEVSFLESATAFSKAADILIVGGGLVGLLLVEVESFGSAKDSNVVVGRYRDSCASRTYDGYIEVWTWRWGRERREERSVD